MNAKLRVLRGKLQTRRGGNAGLEIEVRGARFLIGSSSECKLCCQSKAISPRHCELTRTNGAIWINDLGSQTGTFVNDIRTVGTTRVGHGDRLRVGRLEFELVVPETEKSAGRADPMSEFVTDMLSEADAEDRERRMADPTTRQFDAPAVADSAPQKAEPESSGTAATIPARRPPQKLPPPPKLVSDDSVQAADETLKKILARLKGPKR